MNGKFQAVIQFLSVTLVVVVGTISLYHLDTSVNRPPEITDIFLYFIPISLIIQTLMNAWFTSLHTLQPSRTLYDLISVAVFYSTAILTVLLTTPECSDFVIGGLLVFLTFTRAALQIRMLATVTPSLRYWHQFVLVSLVVSLLLLPLTGWRLANRPLDGDEPFYLLLTHSLLSDHDIDLENNYINRDSLTFLNRELSPQQFDNHVNGRLISRHPPLMALLLLPGFMLGKATGAILTLTLLGGILAAVIFRLLITLKISRRTATLVSVFVLLSNPLRFYSMSVFTEIVAAIAGVYIFDSSNRIASRKKVNWFLLLLCIIFTISLKLRFAVLCLPPVFLALIFRSEKRRIIWRVIITSAALLLIIGAVNMLIYGSALARYSFHDLTDVSGIRLFRGSFGLLLDQQYGLLPLNPVFSLSLLGIVLLFQRYSKETGLLWCSSVLPTYFMVACFAELTGGICPRGRFLVAWLPLLSIPLALTLERLKRSGYQTIYYSLISLSVTVCAIHIIQPNWQIVFPGSTDMIPAVIAQQIDIDVLHIIPSFDRVTDSLIPHGIAFLCILLVFNLYLLRLNGKDRRVTFKKISLSILSLTLFLVFAGLTGWHYQTEWMEFEDASFQREGDEFLFWEETTSWESTTSSDSPYRSGVRLLPGGSVKRSLPPRNARDRQSVQLALEVIARGMDPVHGIPSFSIHAGEKKLGEFRLKSNYMESYYCPWPYGTLAFAPDITISHSSNEAETGIEFDRVRLVSWEKPWPMQTRRSDRYLPVTIGPVKFTAVSTGDGILSQGNPMPIKINYETTSSITDYHFGIMLKSETRTSQHLLNLSSELGESALTTEISVPPEIGNGMFHLLLWGRESGLNTPLVNPTGLHCYNIGNRAWIGKVDISSAPVASDSIWRERILAKSQLNQNQDLILLPESVHLAAETNLTIPLQLPLSPHQSISKVILISHMSSVFREIPFESQIGNLSLVTDQESAHFSVVIGRHTAEAMYHFGGKDLMISHACPDPFHRETASINWPEILSGIEFEALYFKAEFPVYTHIEPIELRVQSNHFPGTWNIYAIAFVINNDETTSE